MVFIIFRWRDVKLRAFDNAKHRTYVDLKVMVFVAAFGNFFSILYSCLACLKFVLILMTQIYGYF